MIRVGIIGCGKIADQHAEEIQKLPGSEIVGVLDSEVLMAKQLCERFKIPHYFTEVDKLLDAVSPGVVHITTPPQSHFELGMRCFQAGCSVYMEKPFTVNLKEAETLIEETRKRKVKITVGHNYQFNQVAREMRSLIQNGFLGGPPLHMESYYCYDLGDEGYAKALLADKGHWVRKLPGKLLHNNISHGICKIAEFFPSDTPVVVAHGFTSPLLKKIGEIDILDELRVILSDGKSTTAYYTFSSQLKPPLHQFCIYGPRNSIFIDDNTQTIIRHRGSRYKSYLNRFIPPFTYGKQYLGNSLNNMKRFIRRDLHESSGLKYLIESFHRSVSDGAPLPIPYREVLLTAKIMEQVFEQLHAE